MQARSAMALALETGKLSPKARLEAVGLVMRTMAYGVTVLATIDALRSAG